MVKMLILGSDFFTLPVVLEAKKLGAYVIVADLMDTSPTKEAADESWLISTNDIDKLEKLCIKNEVTAIMFGASDFNVGNARILCKRLGLPIYCDNDIAWETSRDKSMFKKACLKNGTPVAKDFFLSDEPSEEELTEINYPVVVKPVDLSGNRGITFCDTKEELLEGFRLAKSMSDNKNIVIEKKLVGTEHHICYAVSNGEIRLISFAESNHDKNQASNVYSFSRNSSRFLKQYINEVNESLIKTFKDIGCKEGIVWVDAMRDENEKKFFILEMGYRFAAAMASCHLYEKVSGFNSIRWMVEYAMGIPHALPKGLNEAYKPTIGLTHMFTKHSANIVRVEGLDVLDAMDNVYVDMPRRRGGAVRGMATIALISMYAENGKELADTLKIVNENFKAIDDKGENILIYYTDYENIEKTYLEGLLDFNS